MTDRTVEQHAEDAALHLRVAIATRRQQLAPGTPEKYPTTDVCIPVLIAERLLDGYDALARLAGDAERLRKALTAIRDLPGEYDLLTNAMAKATWTYADRALASPPADTEQP